MKYILLPPPPPIAQAYTGDSLVAVLPGYLLCRYRPPREASCACLQPDRTREACSMLSSGDHDTPKCSSNRKKPECPGCLSFWEWRAICALWLCAAPSWLPKQKRELLTRGELGRGPGSASCSSLFFECLHLLVPSYWCKEGGKTP